jgi:hypothetical protein
MMTAQEGQTAKQASEAKQGQGKVFRRRTNRRAKVNKQRVLREE